MSAPTNAALLDYETNIEDALGSYLSNVLTATQVLTPRTVIGTAQILTTPRVTLSVQISGTDPNQQNNRATDSLSYDSHKLGSVTLSCVTRRDGSGLSLGTLRGRVRTALLSATAALTSSNLPYYEIRELREGASTVGSDADNDEIICTINYSLAFFILPTQWSNNNYS